MALTDKVEIARRSMVLFFVIDSSGSMDGDKIGSVNTAIQEVIPALREVSDENADAEIKVAALEFSSGVSCITKGGPVAVDQFTWKFINAGGVTDFGAVCKELNDKLSTKAFMREATGSYAPTIFLLSDGDPTDDWESALDTLRENGWFKRAVKVAIAIGDEANKDILAKFTGSMEAVMEVRNIEKLKNMIKFVSVRASQVASRSSNVSGGAHSGEEEKQVDINAAIQEVTSDQEDL